MKTTDFNKKVTSTVIAENIEKLFDLNVDLTKYTREQLEDYRNKLRTRVFQHEGNSKINDLLTNEEYQKDKAMLELLNTRIKEMLGEQMKNLLGKLDQLNEAKKAKKDYDGDGKIESPKDEVWGSRAKAAAKAGKPFGKKNEGVEEAAKPDFLDLDKDGDKKEPMKKAAKEKKVKEEKVDEKAVSKAQQQAAGVALAAKKAGKTPPGKGAAAQMAKMSTKELEKFAGTKHKGLPKHKKKADESAGDEELDEFFFFKSNEKPNHDPLAKRKPGDVKKAGAAGYKDVVKNPKNPLSIKGKRPDLPQQENKELLPKQKAVAKKILDKDMADAKADRAAKKQAGTMKHTNESFRKNVELVNEGLIRFLKEDEEGKAKAITAASDMVNDFTSWMQRVGQYQTKSMIELADAIRADFGAQEAETFKQTVGPALAATLETLTQQREVLSNAVAVLAGEAAPEVPMGQEPMEPGLDTAEPDALNTGDELDAFAATDAAAGDGVTGREVRESAEERKARFIAEQHSIIARLAK